MSLQGLNSTASTILSKLYDPAPDQSAAPDANSAGSALGSGAAGQGVSKFYDPAVSNAAPGGPINYGGPAQAPASDPSTANAQANGQGTDGDDVGTMLKKMLLEMMQLITQLLQSQNSNPSSDDSSDASAAPSAPVSGGGGGGGVPTGTAQPDASDPLAGGTIVPPTDVSKAAVAAAPAATDPAAAAPPLGGVASASAPTAAAPAGGDGPTAGTGPRMFNVTNTQDKPINIGQFDKDNKLVAQMTLQPGQTGHMKFENDTTGLLKQADSDGNYQPNASRLEFYNGFINTSDIDGRNASIAATDHNGFNIGDSKSIAGNAPSDITTQDSAGNKTIAGFYDGSTDTMNKGANYMIDQLSQGGQSATGQTYFHPNDDTLGQGNNPMRHTDAMSVDVTFGKA